MTPMKFVKEHAIGIVLGIVIYEMFLKGKVGGK